MKVLLLLRHAKSSWATEGQDDFDRPLSNRGRRAARAMGDHLKDQGLCPALVLCSTARRTRQTCDIVLSRLPDTEVTFEQDLYEASRPSLLDRLHRVAAGVPSVMVIGHNPGIERLAQGLVDARAADDRALARLREKYPAGALTLLTAPVATWDALAAASCRLDAFVRPVDLGGE